MPDKHPKHTDTKGKKPWLKRINVGAHPSKRRSPGKRFLIVCEGQTEELYFKAFPVITATIHAVPLGMSNCQLVEHAIRLAKLGQYDEVWIVFDMDFKPGVNGQFQEFNRAIALAKGQQFKCAYSNDAFELWFFLHFQYTEQQNLRTYYYKTLGSYWSINYEKHGKEKAFSSTIYGKLLADPKSDQAKAIAHAQRLAKLHEGKPYHEQNPATTVHLLVTELNRHLRP
jgi:RloB-like protein